VEPVMLHPSVSYCKSVLPDGQFSHQMGYSFDIALAQYFTFWRMASFMATFEWRVWIYLNNPKNVKTLKPSQKPRFFQRWSRSRSRPRVQTSKVRTCFPIR